jgi:hypothetical protein
MVDAGLTNPQEAPMAVDIRTAVITGAILSTVGVGFAAPAVFPAAFADEPASHVYDTARDLFPPKFDPRTLKKFDVDVDDSVSTKAQHTEFVTKISGGVKTIVAIVTTATGVYSTDGLASPNIRYPGIEVTQKHRGSQVFFGSATGPRGTTHWTSVTSGSFTYFHQSFEPGRRS